MREIQRKGLHLVHVHVSLAKCGTGLIELYIAVVVQTLIGSKNNCQGNLWPGLSHDVYVRDILEDILVRRSFHYIADFP